MAYRNSTFYPLGNQSGRDHAPAKYIYRTDDSIATIVAADYFDDIKSRLSMGDEIEVQFVTFTSATDDTFTSEHGKAKLVVTYKGNDLLNVQEIGKNSSIVFGTMTDVSTAGTALGGGAATDGNLDVVSNVAGRITKITTILGGAITTGDAVLTTGNEGTDVQFLNDNITVANAASAKGDVDSASPNGDNLVAVGETIRMTSDGGSTVAQELFVMFEIEEIAQTKTYVSAFMATVSTAGQIYIASPVAGTITNIWTALNGAIITADAALTGKINGTAITGGALTITQAGSAAGDIDTATPTAANVVAVGDAIEMETDGASGNAVAVSITYEITS